MESPEEIALAKAQAVAVATAAIAGELSPILAARKLLRLFRTLRVPDDDVDFRCFQGLDSETDALPVGPERENWAADALLRKDAEIREAETWARSFGAQSLENVRQRWGKA